VNYGVAAQRSSRQYFAVVAVAVVAVAAVVAGVCTAFISEAAVEATTAAVV